MRRVAAILVMLLIWIALLACCWRGAHAIVVPDAPVQTFYERLRAVNVEDQKFDLVSLSETEALLEWADDNGIHQMKMSRKDFDGMFGRIRVEPLEPEEQQK